MQQIYVSGSAQLSNPDPLPGQDQKICHTYSPRIIRPKTRPIHKMTLTDHLVSQTIRTYPKRIERRHTLPPFIHKFYVHPSIREMEMSDPFIACQEIARTFYAKDNQIEPSIWHAIISEQERIYMHRASFDKWQLLASAQALTIYLLIRITDVVGTPSHDASIDTALLFTLKEVYTLLHQAEQDSISTAEQKIRTKQTWEDWIFVESKLRTAAIYFIVTIHFDIEFGLPCNSEHDYELEDVQLPAARTLWEAGDEETWRGELKVLKRKRDAKDTIEVGEHRLTLHDLVRENRRDAEESHEESKKEEVLRDRLDEWFEEFDELGMILAISSTAI